MAKKEVKKERPLKVTQTLYDRMKVQAEKENRPLNGWMGNVFEVYLKSKEGLQRN
jgi:hypothetical protein